MANCLITGRWRIVRSDEWGRDYLDFAGPASFTIGTDGWGEFSFGALEAGGSLQYARTIVWCRWHGVDEGDEISGELSAELQEDGSLEIELSIEDGDDVILIARRE